MKKFLVFIVSFILLFSVCACQDKNAPLEEETQSTGINYNSPLTTIVENGSSQYCIAIPDDASEAVRFAATDFQGLVEQSTGAKLEIKNASSVGEEKHVSLGKTSLLESAGFTLDYSKLNTDGFFIKTKDGSIYVVGENDRGTAYGAYEFVERFLGIRFITEDETYVPQNDRLAIHELNIMEAPAFAMRKYFSYVSYLGDPLFRLRTRMYGGEKVEGISSYDDIWYSNEFGGSGHNSIDYVKKELYGKTHPEFYASHTNPSLAASIYDDLCYSNGVTDDGKLDENMTESVAKVTLASLKEYATKNPTVDYYFIGMADHMGGWCNCSTCMARYATNGTRSSTVIMFCNLMAKELNKWSVEQGLDREFNIGFFAYFWAEQPPTHVDAAGNVVPNKDYLAVDKNVYVKIAPLKANFAYGVQDERQFTTVRNNFTNWDAITDNIMVWTYDCYFHDYSRYFPGLAYFAEDLKYFESIGVVYMLNQSSWTSPTDWQGKLKYYLASKLYWDTSLDVGALIDEFLTLYYGELGAPYVKQLMETYENHFAYLKSQKGFSIDVTAVSPTYNGFEYYHIGMLEGLVELMEKGEDAIANSSLTTEEKELYTKRLYEVKITPLVQILKDYANYYADDTGKAEMVEKLKICTEATSTLTMGESISLGVFLKNWGIS